MLEEDDDVLLFIVDDNFKVEFKKYFLKFYGEFKDGFSVFVINLILENLEVVEKVILEKIFDFVWVWCMFF